MSEALDQEVPEDAQETLEEGTVSVLDLPDDQLPSFDTRQFTAEPETKPDVEEEAEEEESAADKQSPLDAEDTAAGEEGDEDGEPAKAKPEAKAEPAEKADEPTKTVDYEAEYKKLFAPFKANGKEIQVTSVEDAIALMQMGANYNKKMAGLKPNLKLLKLLENNGLLDEAKLSFLIDLDKKDPKAIGKLVKDSGLDPLDMDVEKESEYKPKTYTVDDRELALDEVIEKIQDSPTYAQVIDVVSNKWDGPSKRVIADTPQLLSVINDHMASGVYGVISKEIERERMLGRLNGLSDLQAYQKVGDAIQARGGFDHLFKEQSPAPAKTVVTPPVKQEDPALRDKRRAASPTKATAPVAGSKVINPLDLSDEEFAKLGNPKFM